MPLISGYHCVREAQSRAFGRCGRPRVRSPVRCPLQSTRAPPCTSTGPPRPKRRAAPTQQPHLNIRRVSPYKRSYSECVTVLIAIFFTVKARISHYNHRTVSRSTHPNVKTCLTVIGARYLRGSREACACRHSRRLAREQTLRVRPAST